MVDHLSDKQGAVTVYGGSNPPAPTNLKFKGKIMKDKKFYKKTISFKSITGNGSLAATSLNDMKKAGKKAGKALKNI